MAGCQKMIRLAFGYHIDFVFIFNVIENTPAAPPEKTPLPP